MSIKMKIYSVRHGHAQHNAGFDKIKNRSVYRSFQYKDSHLTEKGVEQIKTIHLPKMDRVYSSPLIRCIETSRILVGDEQLLYLHDGLTETQGPYPCNWRSNLDTFIQSLNKYNLENVKEKYSPYTDYYLPNKSETWEELNIRATNTLESIKKECAHMEHILIVTHNDWLESLFGRPFMNGEIFILEN